MFLLATKRSPQQTHRSTYLYIIAAAIVTVNFHCRHRHRHLAHQTSHHHHPPPSPHHYGLRIVSARKRVSTQLTRRTDVDDEEDDRKALAEAGRVDEGLRDHGYALPSTIRYSSCLRSEAGVHCGEVVQRSVVDGGL